MSNRSFRSACDYYETALCVLGPIDTLDILKTWADAQSEHFNVNVIFTHQINMDATQIHVMNRIACFVERPVSHRVVYTEAKMDVLFRLFLTPLPSTD